MQQRMSFEVSSKWKRLQRSSSSFTLNEARQCASDNVKAHLALEDDYSRATLKRYERKAEPKISQSNWSATEQRLRSSGSSVQFNLSDDRTSRSSGSSSDFLFIQGVGATSSSTLSQFVVTKNGSSANNGPPCRSAVPSERSESDECKWFEHNHFDISLITDCSLIGRHLEQRWNEQLIADNPSKDKREVVGDPNKGKRQRPAYSNTIRPRALYPILAEQKCDEIKAICTNADTRLEHLDVVEGPNGALCASESQPSIGIHPGDVILELNGASCIGMSGEFFQTLFKRTSGKSRKLVVLKRRQTTNLDYASDF